MFEAVARAGLFFSEFLLYITDGSPGIGQDPCAAIQDLYIPYGIKVLPIGVGAETASAPYWLNCAATGGFDALFYNTWSRSLATNAFKVAFQDCNYGKIHSSGRRAIDNDSLAMFFQQSPVPKATVRYTERRPVIENSTFRDSFYEKQVQVVPLFFLHVFRFFFF